MKPDTSREKIFWLSLAGVSLSSIWVEILGLAAASLVVQRHLRRHPAPRGRGASARHGLVAIAIGTVTVNAMNDYSGFARPAGGGRAHQAAIRRDRCDAVAFVLTLWLQHRRLRHQVRKRCCSSHYWVPPFVAVQMVDWWRRAVTDVSHIVEFNCCAQAGMRYLPWRSASPRNSVHGHLVLHRLGLVAWLQYGDIAFLVGFVVGGVIYFLLRVLQTKSLHEASRQDRAKILPAEVKSG